MKNSRWIWHIYALTALALLAFMAWQMRGAHDRWADYPDDGCGDGLSDACWVRVRD